MFDFKPTLVDKLKTATGLPVLYELACDSSTKIPCITYRETNNYDDAVGTTIGYSRVSYTIKVWGGKLSTLSGSYRITLDKAMRELGFSRVSYNELVVDDKICLIFNYRGLGKEELSV